MIFNNVDTLWVHCIIFYWNILEKYFSVMLKMQEQVNIHVSCILHVNKMFLFNVHGNCSQNIDYIGVWNGKSMFKSHITMVEFPMCITHASKSKWILMKRMFLVWSLCVILWICNLCLFGYITGGHALAPLLFDERDLCSNTQLLKCSKLFVYVYNQIHILELCCFSSVYTYTHTHAYCFFNLSFIDIVIEMFYNLCDLTCSFIVLLFPSCYFILFVCFKVQKAIDLQCITKHLQPILGFIIS